MILLNISIYFLLNEIKTYCRITYVFAVAVGWALFAGSRTWLQFPGGFVVAVFAGCQPLVGVFFEGFAVLAEFFVAFFGKNSKCFSDLFLNYDLYSIEDFFEKHGWLDRKAYATDLTVSDLLASYFFGDAGRK